MVEGDQDDTPDGPKVDKEHPEGRPEDGGVVIGHPWADGGPGKKSKERDKFIGHYWKIVKHFFVKLSLALTETVIVSWEGVIEY